MLVVCVFSTTNKKRNEKACFFLHKNIYAMQRDTKLHNNNYTFYTIKVTIKKRDQTAQLNFQYSILNRSHDPMGFYPCLVLFVSIQYPHKMEPPERR